MVVLGLVELLEGDDLHRDRLVETARGRQLVAAALGRRLLFGVVIEDGRPVLRTAVDELAVAVGRVDQAPEALQQAFIGDDLRVVMDLNRFRVPGGAARYLVVGRILGGAAAVTGDRITHAGDLLEPGFHAPEAAAGEGCDRFVRRRLHRHFGGAGEGSKPGEQGQEPD